MTHAYSNSPRRFSCLIFILALPLLLAFLSRGNAAPVAADRIGNCVQAIFQQTNPVQITNRLIYETSLICQHRLHYEGLIRDFELRRNKFDSQAYQEGILLWMVVSITIAGVFLAGLQLFLAYKLATSGGGNLAESNSFDLERGKLSVKSSVTGLLVLICSFAFFWVFVREIYIIKPIDVDRGGEQAEKKQSAASIQSPFENEQKSAGPLVPDSPPGQTAPTLD